MSEPTDPFDELTNILIQERLDSSDLIFNSQKLLEVIDLEVKHCILPQMKGRKQDFYWSDGNIHIYISIHVEGVDQYSYSIELKGFS
jgi:hypothetical protein